MRAKTKLFTATLLQRGLLMTLLRKMTVARETAGVHRTQESIVTNFVFLSSRNLSRRIFVASTVGRRG